LETYDPVPAVGEAGDHGGAKGTRRVHRGPSEEEREKMARKEREADADGRKGRGFVLLSTQHEHSQAKGRGDEHLDEDSLGVVDTWAWHRAIKVVDQ
jgi:hypothetical protein